MARLHSREMQVQKKKKKKGINVFEDENEMLYLIDSEDDDEEEDDNNLMDAETSKMLKMADGGKSLREKKARRDAKLQELQPAVESPSKYWKSKGSYKGHSTTKRYQSGHPSRWNKKSTKGLTAEAVKSTMIERGEQYQDYVKRKLNQPRFHLGRII